MEEWNAQKMLDLYIHDYLVRKNLHTAADTLAYEANIPRSVVTNPPEGFLSEWWSVFWDVYCSRVGINPSCEQASISTPPQTSTNVNYTLQNIYPTGIWPELPNMLQADNSTPMPKPEMESLLNVIPPMIPDPTLNARDVEHFFHMQPSSSCSSGSRKKKVNDKRQSPLSQSVNISTGLKRPTISEITLLASKKFQESAQQADPGFPFRMVRTLHTTDNNLSCCDFSTQGRFLAAGGHDNKVIIWNLSLSSKETLQGHTQLITDVRFQPNSTMFATSSFDGTVKIWDAINTNKMISNLVGHEGQVTSLDFHPKSLNILCSCDSNDIIRLWNVKKSTCFGVYKGGNKQVRFQPRQGKLLAAVTGNTINLINVETGVIQQRFEGHEKEIRSMCWDVCGEYLVSTSEDSTRIWSLVSGGKCIHELRIDGTYFTSCTFHPAYSQVVAIGSYQCIYIWNPTMGNKTWTYPAHQGIISAMANSPEMNMMASVSHDQWIKLWR